MARTDTEQLVVSLEARVRDFERGMQKAAGTADKQFGRMNRSAKASAATMENTMKQATSRINGALGKIGLGGLGLTGFAALAQRTVSAVAEIGEAAKQAGLDSKSFQELAFVAKKNRLEVESLTAGMRELSLRGAEFFNTGSGSAADAFKALGYSAEEVRDKLKQPSQFLSEIIGKVQNLDKASQIMIFDQLFGGDGERFVRLIDQGAAGIAATVQEAHRLDAVLSDDLIKDAAELDRKFNTVATTVGTALKRAIVEAAGALGDFMDRFNFFENQQDSTLGAQMTELGRERLDVETKILELREKQASGGTIGDGWFGTSVGETDFGTAFQDLERRKEALAAEEQMISDVLEARRKLRETPPSSTTTQPLTTLPPPSAGTRDKEASEAERQAKSVRELIAELQQELTLVGASNTEREIANTLRRAGVDAASKEGQQIADLVTQIEAETEARERNRQAQEEQKAALGNLFAMAEDSITAMIDNSQNAEDAVKRLAVQLALAAAQAALLGDGPLAGLFGGGSGGGLLGNLFGGGGGFKPNTTFAGFLGVPGFAKGTRSAPGGLAVVGEKGPELIQLPKGSQVFPKVPDVLPAGGGATNVTVHFNPQIDNRGASVEAVARTQQQLDTFKSELPARVVQAVRDAQKRRQL